MINSKCTPSEIRISALLYSFASKKLRCEWNFGSEFNLVLVPKMAMMFLVIITSYESLPCTQYNFPCGNSVKLLYIHCNFKNIFYMFLSHRIHNLDTQSRQIIFFFFPFKRLIILSVNYTFFRRFVFFFFKGGVSSVILVCTGLLEVHVLDIYSESEY